MSTWHIDMAWYLIVVLIQYSMLSTYYTFNHGNIRNIDPALINCLSHGSIRQFINIFIFTITSLICSPWPPKRRRKQQEVCRKPSRKTSKNSKRPRPRPLKIPAFMRNNYSAWNEVPHFWQNPLPAKVQHGFEPEQKSWNKPRVIATWRKTNCTKLTELS